ADVGQQEFALLGAVRARPAEQKLRRQRIEHDRGRRPGRKHPLDPCRHRHRASGPVGHGRGTRQARRKQRGCESGPSRAAIEQHHTPTMTSEALMTAHASSPFLRLRSATASLVIAALITMPWPMSMWTWEVVVPFLTSTILPLSWLRALSFFMIGSWL